MRTSAAATVLGAALAQAVTSLPASAAPSVANRIAVLQGLDKVTARISVVEAPIGEEVRFGRLAITARTCLETPPTEPPESAAFLEIRTLEPDQPARTDFVGWMLASSPGLSALEHPVYDVWVIDCREPVEAESGTAGVSAGQ